MKRQTYSLTHNEGMNYRKNIDNSNTQKSHDKRFFGETTPGLETMDDINLSKSLGSDEIKNAEHCLRTSSIAIQSSIYDAAIDISEQDYLGSEGPSDQKRIRPPSDSSISNPNSNTYVSTSTPMDPGLPSCTARVDAGDCCEYFTALIDTGSTLSFVTVDALKKLNLTNAIRTCKNQVIMETMSGCHPTSMMEVELETSLCDSNGEWSPQRNMRFLVYEKTSIPGGFDILISSEVVNSLGIVLKGTKEGYQISLNHKILIDKIVQADIHSSDGSVRPCGFVAAYDAEADDIEEHFLEDDLAMAELMKSLPLQAIALGPLTQAELLQGSKGCAPVEMTLTFKKGQEHPPVNELGYSTTDDKHCKLMKLLQVLEEERIIRRVPRNSGKFLSPGFAVRKGSDQVRLVVNLQSLNSRLLCIPGIQYHNMSEWLRNIPSWSTHFSVLDVKNAFYSLPCSEASKPYLHMSIWDRSGFLEYEWLRCPQGLATAPSWWIEHIERVLSSLKDFLNQSRYSSLLTRSVLLAYADDILVGGRNEADTKLLSEILYQFLLFNRLYVPELKFQRAASSVQVMGFTLSSGGELKLSAKNLEKLHALRKPSTRKELNSALGLLNYVRFSLNDRLDLGNSSLHSLYELKDGKGPFRWEARHNTAWKILVEEFQNLAIYSWSTSPGVESNTSVGLVISTDASDIGTGYAAFIVPLQFLEELDDLDLQKLSRDGHARLVSLGSRRFTGSERFYISFDKEGLGVYHALMKARPWILLVEKTILFTDNTTAISRFKGQDKNPNLTRGKRWLRWVSDVSDLLYGPRPVLIRHLAGPLNVLADHLSRFVLEDLSLGEASTQTEGSKDLVLTTIGEIQNHSNPMNGLDMHDALSAWEEDITSEYIKRVRLYDIYLYLNAREDEIGRHIDDDRNRNSYVTSVQQASNKFSLLNGVLHYFYKGQSIITVPNSYIRFEDGSNRSLRLHIIKWFHEESLLSSHRGQVQTMGQIRRHYWWPSMDKQISDWVSSCEGCQLNKAREFHDYSTRIINGPNLLLMVDWCGPLQGVYVLIMVDSFSLFTMAIPYPVKNSNNVIDALLQWCSILGAPQFWGSDLDSTFVSQVSRDLRKSLKIRDITSPAHSPQTQGGVESKVGAIKRCLERFILNDTDLPVETLLKAAVWTANSCMTYGNLSAFEVIFGRQPKCPLGVSISGISDGIQENETVDSYVDKVRSKLASIQEYWLSKSQELRTRSIDNVRSSIRDLPANRTLTGRCIRVAYKAQRREVLEIVEVVSKLQDSHNTYQVRRSNGSLVMCHGYQLIPLIESEERRSMTPIPAVEEQTTRRSMEMKRMLRISELGTFIACDHNHEGIIYIGRMIDYPFADHVLVQYLIPDGSEFREPITIIEREQWTEHTPVPDIILSNVFVECLEGGRFRVPLSQFGGSVVSLHET